MNSQSFFDTLRIKITTRVVQLRPKPEERAARVARDGEEYSAVFDRAQGWISLPTLDDHGLLVREWKEHWDECRIEVYKDGDIPFEEADWTHLILDANH